MPTDPIDMTAEDLLEGGSALVVFPRVCEDDFSHCLQVTIIHYSAHHTDAPYSPQIWCRLGECNVRGLFPGVNCWIAPSLIQRRYKHRRGRVLYAAMKRSSGWGPTAFEDVLAFNTFRSIRPQHIIVAIIGHPRDPFVSVVVPLDCQAGTTLGSRPWRSNSRN